jgi:hypothetical protein
MTVTTDNAAFAGPDSISAVPSAPSYATEIPSVGTSDGSATSCSVQGSASVSASPARSVAPPTSPSIPSIPSNASVSASPSLRRQNLDLLLDDQSLQAYPASRDRTGLTSSDDDHTEPSSETGNNSLNVGYTRSDVSASVTSTFGRLIESTKVSVFLLVALGTPGKVNYPLTC